MGRSIIYDIVGFLKTFTIRNTVLSSSKNKTVRKKLKKMVGRGEGKYFHTTKKGEIHEYKEELHLHDESRRMDAVKKVI